MPVDTGELLVVDDHPLYSDALVLMLRAALGVRVTSVPTLQLAIPYVASGSLRLVIVDLTLPDSTPTQTCEWIKGQHPGTRSLVISGTQSLQDARRD